MFSFLVSKAEVASSKSKILGFFSKALAIAILYFCPPESMFPFVPTYLSYLVPKFYGSTLSPFLSFFLSFYSFSISSLD